MTFLAATLLNPTVDVTCEKPEGWTFSVNTVEVEPGVRVAKIRATSPDPAPPPTFTAVVSFPQIDIASQWNPNFGCSENMCFLPWWGNVFNVARTQLIHAWLDPGDANRLTLAAGELRREIKFGGGLKEEDFRYYAKVVYFTDAREPMTEYETLLRLDARPVAFDTAVRAAAAWQADLAGGRPAVPPDAAWEPLYSTWYNFHKDVTAQTVEAELAEAAALGMKVVILDDGWQCDDIERSYQSCGDWFVSPKRFPDMRGHVARVHALGMKYMVWFSMPFVGEKTAAFQRLKGKFLRYDPHMKAHVIDPRFPDCRAYLREVYLRCLKEWDIDGFKLDFVDAFGLEGAADPALAEDYAGRDCRAISEGVERLLREVTAALNAAKPDLLLEFRQAYVGPVIRKYGNMMRVGDCPGSLVRNRVHIANMRLLCEGSAVHSDMLRWHGDETPARAQRFILNSLFGVVQYSMMLKDATPETKAMIAKWIAFTREHRETLLKGAFRPHFPHLDYPVIEAESAAERIVVIYDPSVRFDLGNVDKPTYVIDGVTGEMKVHGKPKTRAVNVDTGRQLFVDDHLVETTDLRRVWHQPKKFEGNPVLKPETPWEVNVGGNAVALPKGGGIWWDEQEGVFKLWYEGGWLKTVCYATSKDGVRFERPNLDLYPGTNIVLPTNNPCYRPDSWSVVRDPATDDESQRYKLLLHRPWAEPQAAPEGVTCVSPDGIHWREVAKLAPSGDRSSLFYDPFREKWVYSIRSSWSDKEETGGKRNRMIWEQDDFLEGARWGWTGKGYGSDGTTPGPERWLEAAPEDGSAAQLYCFDAVAYESLMLGLFEIHHGPENGVCEKAGLPKITDVKFGFSRDGRHFFRGENKAAIASERWGSDAWDTGYVQPVANGCVIMGDELWFYYGAFRGAPERASSDDKRHDWRIDNGMYANGAMGIAKLRRDGFASLEGSGSVLTRPLHFSGEYLFVNVAAPEGAIAVDLLDRKGAVVEGFSAAESRLERIDATKRRIVWKTHDRLDVRKWDDHRLRFRLENAALYSFWVSQTPNGESNGYLAGGGPGHDGLRDVPKAARAVVPPSIHAPDAAHAKATRRHEGIPSIEVSPKGTMWATWYAGKTPYEDENNYLVLARSDDNGITWREFLVCDPDGEGPRRVFDPELWLAPDGKLRWTWTDKLGPCMALPDGDQLWMVTLDPETGLVLEPPRVIAKGIMMCKPTVLRDGTWLFPVAQWWGRESAAVYASTDGGRTFAKRGGVTVPKEKRGFDEHCLLEKRDGTLKCYIRTFNGDGNCLWSAESTDGGRTWTKPVPDPLASCSSRSVVRRLASGAWLAVVHGPWRKWTKDRSDLTALISHDDGETWEGGLLVDGRHGCSYPDMCQDAEGRLTVISDFDRTGTREVSCVTFTERDVLGYGAAGPRRIVTQSSNAGGVQ